MSNKRGSRTKKEQAVDELLNSVPAVDLMDFIFQLQNDSIASGMTERLTERGRNDMTLKFSSLFEFAKSLEAVK